LKFKKNSTSKNEGRCKTLVDEESSRKIEKINSRQKVFYKKLSKDNLFETVQGETIKRK